MLFLLAIFRGRSRQAVRVNIILEALTIVNRLLQDAPTFTSPPKKSWNSRSIFITWDFSPNAVERRQVKLLLRRKSTLSFSRIVLAVWIIEQHVSHLVKDLTFNKLRTHREYTDKSEIPLWYPFQAEEPGVEECYWRRKHHFWNWVE